MFACVLYSPPAYILCMYIALRFLCILLGRALVGKLHKKRGATAAGPAGSSHVRNSSPLLKTPFTFSFLFLFVCFCPRQQPVTTLGYPSRPSFDACIIILFSSTQTNHRASRIEWTVVPILYNIIYVVIYLWKFLWTEKKL